MRSSWFLITLAGFALGAVGYFGGRSSAAAPKPLAIAPSADDARELMALQAQVRSLQAANAALSRQNRAAEARAELNAAQANDELAKSDPVVEADPPPLAADEHEIEERARQERIQYFDELSKRVDTEQIDGAWRHRTEAPLQQLLAKHLSSEIHVAEATCASSYCRVKLTHPQAAHLRAGSTFDFDLARASLELTEVTFDNREQGSTTLYFKRGPAPAAALADSNPPDAR